MDFSVSEHLDPTDEISLEAVKSRAVGGVVALTGRTLIFNLIALFAQGFLWAFLTPSEFGVFFIVSAIVNFLTYFSDIGLAAALIQKKEKPVEEDYKTTFTIQQILVLTLLIILVVLSPTLKRIYSLSNESLMLLYALGFSFFLSSLKSIPSAILERRLEFGKFIIPQVFENLVYNVALVFFAWKGFGISSFTFSVLIRGIVGLIVIYILQPWKPGFSISRKSLKELLTFGIPYQLNTFLAVLKDDGMVIILGSILGAAGMGILGTARKLAQYPLRFFMDNVTKVTFPAFSRMQGESRDLRRSLTRSIFFITLLVFPSLVGLTIIAPVIVKVIPRYEKWTPALLPLAIVSIDSFFAAATTQLTNFFNAIGKIKLTFKLMIMWTVLTLILLPILSLKFGVIGASIGYALVGISSIVAIVLAKKKVNFSLFEAVAKPLVASLIMGVVLFILRYYLSGNLRSLLILIVVGFVTYAVSILSMVGYTLIEDVKKSFSALFSR